MPRSLHKQVTGYIALIAGYVKEYVIDSRNQALVITTISIAFPARLLLLLLLLSPPCRGATLRIESPLVLTDSSQHLIATVRVREQTRMRQHICVVIAGNGTIIANQMIEKLSVSAVKLRSLESSKFIAHHALFEEIKIDLAHILYRVIGRPRRGSTGLLRRGRPRCGRAASLSGLPLSAPSLLRISLCLASASASSRFLFSS